MNSLKMMKIVSKIRREEYLKKNPGFSKPRVKIKKNKKKYNRKRNTKLVFFLMLFLITSTNGFSQRSMNEKKNEFQTLLIESLERMNVETLTILITEVSSSVMKRDVVFTEDDVWRLIEGNFVLFPDVEKEVIRFLQKP